MLFNKLGEKEVDRKKMCEGDPFERCSTKVIAGSQFGTLACLQYCKFLALDAMKF